VQRWCIGRIGAHVSDDIGAVLLIIGIVAVALSGRPRRRN